MTNAKTNSCLPAAPRASGKSSIFQSAYCTLRHSAFRILHSALVIAAVAAMTAGTAFAAPVALITSGTASYGADGEIVFRLFADATIADGGVTGDDGYLVLSGIKNADTAEPHARYTGLKEDNTMDPPTLYLEFTYDVRPGDYSDGVGISQFNLNGMTVTTDSEEEPSLTEDLSSASVLDGETITISTITATILTSSPYYTGDTLSVRVSLGGPATANQTFALSSSDTAKAEVASSTLTINANNESGEFTVNLRAATEGTERVTITIRPYADVPAGDITLSFPITKVDDPAIVEVKTFSTPDGTYDGGIIQIEVILNGEITAFSSTKPTLLLSMEPSGRIATLVGEYEDYIGESSLLFSYEIKSGDAALHLGCIAQTPPGSLYVNNRKLKKEHWQAMPTGNDSGSLSANSDICIETIKLGSSTTGNTRADSRSGAEGATLSFTITRDGHEDNDPSTSLSFNVSPQSSTKIDYQPTFEIPRYEREAVFEMTLVEQTTAPIEVTLHPNNYKTTAGDIVLTITVTPGEKPTLICTTTSVREGGNLDENFQGDKELELAFKFENDFVPKDVRFTFESSDTTKLQFVDAAPALSWQKGDATPKTLRVKPLDNGEVTITATPNNNSYERSQMRIAISNRDPKITSPVPREDGTPFGPVGQGTPYPFSWSGRDVDADLAELRVEINWGDGSPVENFNGANGDVSHVFRMEGLRTVRLKMFDNDGGQDMVEIQVQVDPPIKVLVDEYKYRMLEYKSLRGRGRGTIDDPNALREPQTGDYQWLLKYDPLVNTAILTATPESFDSSEWENSYGEKGTYNFDSFFYVWVGDEDSFRDSTKLVPNPRLTFDPESAAIKLKEGEDILDPEVGGVFAREHYPEDGCPDIDGDELPDGWEALVWPANGTGAEGGTYPFELIATPYGRNDNPDGDFLPACVTGIDAATGDFTVDGCDFSPSGLAFINVYEVRGTHRGLNMDETSTEVVGTARLIVTVTVNEGDSIEDENLWVSVTTNKVDVNELDPIWSDALQDAWIGPETADGIDTYRKWIEETTLYAAVPVEPQDEPHCGTYDKNGVFTDNGTANEFFPWFGTNPTKPDTDEDKLTDGYEYFFWRRAKFADPEKPIGEAYDPTQVVVGKPIDNATVEANFNPCVPNDHLTLDTDGDGLTNFEEFLLGTNPIHWDTDGDGMNDGWEVLWGLNPKDKKDATDNPDGDFMANDAKGRYHWDVYSHYGFDPRTAWNATYLERNRKLELPTPNTAPYSNYHEHYLGWWCIDHGIAAEVGPMSTDFMTQPVPDGTPRFYDPSWKGTKRKVPDHAVAPTGGGGETDDEGGAVAGGGGATAADGGYTVPIGSAAYIVEPVVITTHGCDSDNDGMPDGWELYIYVGTGTGGSLWPTGQGAAIDAGLEYDQDNLSNREEFRSVESCDYYASVCTNSSFAFSGNWFNKWWPSDPFNDDTDGDHLPDGYEGDATFRYQDSFAAGGTNGAATAEAFVAARFGETTMLRGHVPGGGLNPCCIDTDMDYIPDHWEYLYAGNYRDTAWEGGFCNKPGTETGLTVQNGQAFIVLNGAGMDGTYFDSRSGYDEHSHAEDRNFDYDGDGLENYQEYWINGMAHFQYGGKHPWVAGGDYGDYDPQQFFNDGLFPSLKDQAVSFKKWGTSPDPVTEPVDPLFMKWDWSTYANDWQNAGGKNPADDKHVMSAPTPFHYMPSEIRPLPMGPYLYASTDPRLADSDGDGMDDFYEMFHGLNPILSDVVDYCMQEHPAGETYDFRKYPWMAGMPNADPDGDDIPNWEEALSPGQPAPANHNTDPSPLWMTDMSYDHSFVNLYYNWGSAGNFWTTENDEYPEYEYYPFPDNMFPGMIDPRPHYVFDFECNEGFDTDNDNLSDPYEINGTAGGVTDSQNPDRPIGRKALYLDGNAAARTRSICAFGPNALRSFTLEVWVMPEEPASGKMQVILERPVTWNESNTSPTYETIRRNFRLGLLGDGHPFVEFDNGGKNLITERAIADASTILEAGKWYHLAATMDGFAGKLSLYVNGRRISYKSTTAIPYTGFTTTALNAVGSDEYHQPRWSPVVIGASDANPVGQVDGSYDFYNGAILEVSGGQPQLGNFFKGWVDEVRIWDGARPGAEDAGDQRVAFWRWPTIKDDYDTLKRYGMDEIREERNAEIKYLNRIVDWRKKTINSGNAAATASLNGSNPVNGADTNATAAANTTWFFDGRGLSFDEFIQNAVTYILMTGGEDAKCRIPPNLLCVYNFDTLPDPDYEPVQPAKFASLTGRPMDYNGVPWLRGATDRTTVYTSTEAPYLFPQYVQNLVSWQPLGRLAAAGTDTEYDEIIGEPADMPLFAYQPDRVVNSKYWTLYTKGGKNLSDLESYAEWGTDTVNSFPNNANPYGYRYETGLIVDEENHPLTMFQEAYDSEYAVLFNDLVPLRNARADMSVQLWDDPTGDKLGVNKDSDGDGLPDYWEIANGMDPHSNDQNGNGIRDDLDDFDSDGLSNWDEYLAGGLNPFLSDTDADGIPDYQDSQNGGLSYGWLYTDNDYVLDTYELEWDDVFASPFRYDEHEDRDFDGWNNWSEALVGTAFAYNSYNENAGTNSTAGAESSAADKAANFPLPDLNVTLDYGGQAITGAKLVIHAYSDKDMNGWPDAVFVKDFSSDTLNTWPMTVTVGRDDLIYGHLRQGQNWFFAWMDNGGASSGNGGAAAGAANWPTWNDPEPAAIADNQLNGIDIGFDLNEVFFHLTDRAESFARVSWEGFDQLGYEAGQGMYVTMTYAGNFVFKKFFAWPRTWLHEGDIIAYNDAVNNGNRFGLASQSATASDQTIRPVIVNLQPECVYNVHGTAVAEGAGVVSNWVHSASILGAPVLYGPIGREIVSDARPEFRFSLHPECTEFKIVFKKGTAQTTILQTRFLAPGRHYNAQTGKRDLVVWRFPYSVGDKIGNDIFEAGETYSWKLVAYSPAYGTDNSSLVSEEGWFITASASASNPSLVYVPGGKGVIDVDVSYPSDMVAKGGGTTSIRVQAFRSKSFNGIPDASACLAAPGVCRLTGLENGESYYLRAYIEQDGDAERDNWESWGYYRAGDDTETPFLPIAVKASVHGNESSPYVVRIQDCDTDNDLLPDSYEWAVAGDFTSLGVANYAPTVKKTVAYAVSPLAVAAAAHATIDLDNDGVNDYDEFVSGTNPALADTDSDGIADGLENALGFDATTPQALKITSVSFDANGNPVLDWTWDGAASSTKGRAMLKTGRKIAYEVQAKVALTDSEWITIRTVYTDDVDGQAVLTEEGAPKGVNVSAFRFFRVKVGAE